MNMAENIRVDFRYGKHVDEPDTVVLQFKGTGIDTDNADHAKFIGTLVEVIGAQLYAKAHGIDMDKIVMRGKK